MLPMLLLLGDAIVSVDAVDESFVPADPGVSAESFKFCARRIQRAIVG